MTTRTGIKISKTGKSISSTDLRDLILHSNLSMFKYHSDNSLNMTINAEETTKTISFAHGLGYVPAFIAYMGDSNGISMLPNRRSYYFVGADEHYFAYADATNIYITWRSTLPYNRQKIYASDFWNTYGNNNEYFEVGREGSTGYSGALRFTNIQVASGDSILRAKIQIECNGKTDDSSRNMRWVNYGIREANTSNFNDPMGRTRTSATSTQNRTVPTNIGDHVEIDVINMVNEIKGLSGWASGNAMGFLMFEQDSQDNAAFWSFSNSDTYIEITKSGSMTVPFRVIVFKDKIHD